MANCEFPLAVAHERAIDDFVFTPDGHALHVRTANTAAVSVDYIWLDDLPVAQFQDSHDAQGVYIGTEATYLHSDHLGTPRIGTNAGKQITWRNRSDAFGIADLSGSAVVRLRFPGQLSLGVAGLNYNYYRDYDPKVGRYVESDPIGLDGGINTYAYVGGNPVSIIDPEGLAYYCTQPLHALPAGDLGGIGPLHHGFVCNDQGVCGGQDRAGNLLLSSGRPSEGDNFSKAKRAGRCEHTESNQCENQCIADEVLSTRRPAYTAIPGGPQSRAVGVIGRLLRTAGTPQNCQDWAKSTISYCKLKCALK